ADPRGRVGVPREGRPARTAPRLVLRPVRPDRRVVGLLLLPRDDAVADVHLPGAGTRAVDSMSGAHHRVVGPPVPVETVGLPPADLVQRPPVGGHLRPTHEPAERQQGPTGRFGHVCHYASAFLTTLLATLVPAGSRGNRC